MVIEKLRNGRLVDPAQIKPILLYPPKKVGSAPEVTVYGVRRVAALVQIPSERVGVRPSYRQKWCTDELRGGVPV